MSTVKSNYLGICAQSYIIEIIDFVEILQSMKRSATCIHVTQVSTSHHYFWNKGIPNTALASNRYP